MSQLVIVPQIIANGGSYKLNSDYTITSAATVMPVVAVDPASPAVSGVITLTPGSYTATITFTASGNHWRSDWTFGIRTPAGDTFAGALPNSVGTSTMTIAFTTTSTAAFIVKGTAGRTVTAASFSASIA